MNQSPFRRCDGVLRREVLRLGGLSAFGLGLGSFFRIQESQAALWQDQSAGKQEGKTKDKKRKKPKSCILIWLDGGPSHLETFDPKPEAPVEVRGPLGTVKTSISGIHLSECLPQTAKRMKDIAIIRSMTSTLGEHNIGTHYMLTGYQPSPVIEYPSFHSVGASVYDHVSTLPNNVAIPSARVGGSNFSGNGFLSESFRPFSVGGDPAKPEFKIENLDFYRGITLERIERRRDFLKALNQFSDSRNEQLEPAFEQAYRLITSPTAKEAFDLSKEKPSVRAKYGSRTVGQSCLLARRLVERGVPFVTVNAKGWDTHQDMKTRLKDGFAGSRTPIGLVPNLDLAFSALIDDLKARNLFDETLIVVMGEFGRTPKLNTTGGRDHWPRAFSVALAGGGISGGQVIGSSDAVGEVPKSRPVSPSDLVATIYKILGIDPELELKTSDGRPISLTPEGSKVVKELL